MRQPHAVIAADQDADRPAGAWQMSKDCRQAGNTGGHFDHGRVSRGTAHAGSRTVPGSSGRANRGEALGPEQGEHRSWANVDRVGQHRGQVRDAGINSLAKDLASRRDRPLAVDAADQRAGFSRDEPVGHLGHAGYLAQAGASPRWPPPATCSPARLPATPITISSAPMASAINKNALATAEERYG